MIETATLLFDLMGAASYFLSMNQSRPPVMLSGIQPSGNLMIGNYIGAISSWIRLQDSCDCLFPLVDLHAVTVPQNPSVLYNRCLEFVALYIACGIDPEKSTIFIQSHVSEHCQLAWILNCHVSVGELERMTQFKEKTDHGRKIANAGLFVYPVLMAADILLYRTDLVPVGEDQKQHMELTRSLARRFNRDYGDLFTVPKPLIPETGARIMGLRTPWAKMSKSDEKTENYVALLDSPETILKKIKSAVTDPGRTVRYDPVQKPGISNLMTIFSVITSMSYDDMENQYGTTGYSRFKKDVAESLIDFLAPVQLRYEKVLKDRAYISEVLLKGAVAARNRATPVMDQIHAATGFISRQGL